MLTNRTNILIIVIGSFQTKYTVVLRGCGAEICVEGKSAKSP
jgi:hypothetical protein